MKLTWFGGTTFRIQIGGQIVVVNAQSAADGIDRNELVSGADHVLALDDTQPEADAVGWKRRPAERLLDAGDRQRPLQFWSLGGAGLLIDGDDDMPLLLSGGALPSLGRWAESAVCVLFGEDLAARAASLLADRAPKLIALGGGEAEIDAAILSIRGRLDGTGVVALEAGLAVEV